MLANIRSRIGRQFAGLLTVLTLLPLLVVVPASSAQGVETYLLRHVKSGQYLATDAWGPGVLLSDYDGRMAEWEGTTNPDGSLTLRNAVTRSYLANTGGTNGHEVSVIPALSPETSWQPADTAAGVTLANGGVFLVGNGFTARTSTEAGPQGEWELVPVDPAAPRFVSLTNELSGDLLATSIALDGMVITSDFGGAAPASARWELIEQVTTNGDCERHPAWQTQGGRSSRVTTCHVLRNRANDESLDANSEESGSTVTTSPDVHADALWNLSDVADGATITLENAELGGLLADAGGSVVTQDDGGPAARWILGDEDAGCKPLRDVQVDSHAAGETVDTSETGNATGTFFLFGAAPPFADSLVIESGGETGELAVDQSDDCLTGWSIEVGALDSGPQTYTITATGPWGEEQTSIELNVIAPGEDDTLVQPAFATTPQFHDLLLSYDEATGTLVFAGDVSNELEPGDGLGSGIRPEAPDGYLRIVLAVQFDGTNTIVTTRQAGLTEFIRQVQISYSSDAETGPSNITFSANTAPSGEPASIVAAEEPGAVDNQGLLPSEPELGPSAQATQSAQAAPSNSPQALGPIGDDAELSLEFIMDPSADFDLDIGWRRACRFCPFPLPFVKVFSFEVGLDLSAEAEFVYSGATLFERRANFGPKLDDFRFATISVPTPIGIPIVVTFEADSQPFYDISVDAVMRLQYALTFGVVAGFEHREDGTGRGAYRDSDFDGGIDQLDLDIGILAKAAVGLEIDIEGLLYGQAGVEVEATPQIELEAVGDVVDREVAWELKFVVPFAAGVDIEIDLGPLEWEKEIGNLEFLELSFILFSGTIFGDEDTMLSLTQTGPPGVFPGQEFDYTIRVENIGESEATDVDLVVTLPIAGSFVSSLPSISGFPPGPGETFVLELPDLNPGFSTTARVRWRAPSTEGTAMTNRVRVTAANADPVGPVSTTVTTGIEGRCNPCGAAAAGTGLRNRERGTIDITSLPAGATVTRAVLVWGILYSGPTPPSTITFNGTPVTADVGADISGTLCWGDSATIGYAADVTSLVSGNGSYVVSDPPRGITRPDGNPAGVLPYTDGASLVVFYVGGGANNQVISDFSYNTNTAGSIVRTFTGINSLGSPATLTMAGPDGQNNGSERFTVTGSGSFTLFDTWDGSDPHEGPSFAIGNLWDTDHYDVTSVLPAGQDTLTVSHAGGSDCVGVGAAVLQIDQRPPLS